MDLLMTSHPRNHGRTPLPSGEAAALPGWAARVPEVPGLGGSIES